MSSEEWKIKLHLDCESVLRSMAEKMSSANDKATLVKIAEDHEQLAKSLGGTVMGNLERRTAVRVGSRCVHNIGL